MAMEFTLRIEDSWLEQLISEKIHREQVLLILKKRWLWGDHGGYTATYREPNKRMDPDSSHQSNVGRQGTIDMG